MILFQMQNPEKGELGERPNEVTAKYLFLNQTAHRELEKIAFQPNLRSKIEHKSCPNMD